MPLKKTDKTLSMFLQYGISTNLAERAVAAHLNLTGLRALSIEEIAKKGFFVNEASELKRAVTRKPIEDDVLFSLLENSNFVCSACKGTKGLSYIVHHIEPYATSQNNDYDNLIVLCPVDHDLAHRSSGQLSLSLSPDDLRATKANWEEKVRVINAGRALRDQDTIIEPPRRRTTRIECFDDEVADLVACTVAVNRTLAEENPIDIVWSSTVVRSKDLLVNLMDESGNYREPTSALYGLEPRTVADFVSSATSSLRASEHIMTAAAARAELLIKGMSGYWSWKGALFDNVIATALANFLTITNYRLLELLGGPVPHRLRAYSPFVDRDTAFRKMFGIKEPLANAKLTMLSEVSMPEVWFWGPESEVLDSLRWRRGDAVRGTWIDKYLIPQNEFHLIGNTVPFLYNEVLEIAKVKDDKGEEYWYSSRLA